MTPPTEMQILRTFDAPIERVYRAFTDPGDLARWAWGPGAKNPEIHVDLRVGGAYSIYIDNSGKEQDDRKRAGMCGLYVEVVPNEKLVYTLHWDADVGYNAPGAVAPDEVVSVTFEPDGAGTKVEYRHMGIPDHGDAAAEHKKGVEWTFDALAFLLRG